MKIPLRQFLLFKRIMLLAVPVLILLTAALYFLLPLRSSVTAKHKVEPQNKTASNIIPQEKPAPPLAKVRVIKPVRVADEPFKGYYPIPEADRAGDEDQDRSVSLNNEKRNDEAPCEELSLPAGGGGKAIKEPPESDKKAAAMKSKSADHGDQSGKRQSVHEPAGPPDSKSAEEAEVLKSLDNRAIEAGIPEAARKKLLQSYKDLSKVLPKDEAQKMILWKIAHEYTQ
ncbi:MAG: hypothetical protein HZB31_02110 [Nitrospirae bacterium]|nr:hypothetical protein [Nitrospirota bacterium]